MQGQVGQFGDGSGLAFFNQAGWERFWQVEQVGDGSQLAFLITLLCRLCRLRTLSTCFVILCIHLIFVSLFNVKV